MTQKDRLLVLIAMSHVPWGTGSRNGLEEGHNDGDSEAACDVEGATGHVSAAQVPCSGMYYKRGVCVGGLEPKNWCTKNSPSQYFLLQTSFVPTMKSGSKGGSGGGGGVTDGCQPFQYIPGPVGDHTHLKSEC